MIDFIKKAVFFFWNPRWLLIRDSAGKVIQDIQRRRHSKSMTKMVQRKPRKLKRVLKGKVAVSKQEN